MSDVKNGLGLTTDETIAIAQSIEQGPRTPTSKPAMKTGLAAGNLLYGYPLEAPSKKLYFIEDGIRRRIPRTLNQTGGNAAHWKQITSINANKVKAGVAEGNVATALTFTTTEKSQNYRTLNQYNTYTDEARIFGRKFEDIPQLGMLATLQSLMIQEDRYILGGCDVTIGKPASVTAADSATAGNCATTNYYIMVSALTLHGYLNGAAGHVTSDAADESDGRSCNSGVAFSATSGHSIALSWADVKGAFAYNVYIGTSSFAAAAYLGTYTTNSIVISSITATGAGVANTADQTADQYGYQGILQQLVALTGTAGSTGSYGTMTAYYKDCAGAALTGDGAGGVAEVETAIKSIWDSYRASPTLIVVNAQEAKSFKKLAVGSSGTNAVRINISQDDKNKFTAGAAVDTYYNPYTQQLMNILTSVHCPPGKILLLGETVPYPNAETPNNFEVELQQEYYGEQFARTTRQTPVGVTCIGALKLYLPGACGIIANCIAA